MFWKTGLVLAALTFSQVPAEILEPGVSNEDAITGASSADSRISGGWVATAGQFPYAVFLEVIPLTNFVRFGVGSIIHREWVLTSATSIRQSRSVFVRGGFNNIALLPQYHHEVAEIIIHPSFDLSSASIVQRTNIGLLKMRVPFSYTRVVQPIRIQTADSAFALNNVQLLACGWGRTTAAGAMVVNLRFSNLIGITNLACSNVYGVANVFDTHICAQGVNTGSQSICPGDEGSPLTRTGSDGEPVLVGVGVFWDTRGCERGNAAGFIRPGAFHDWYTEVTGLDFEKFDEINPWMS